MRRWVIVPMAFAVLTFGAPAHAATRAGAVRSALAALGAARDGNDVAVYALRHALPRGTRVGEFPAARGAKVRDVRLHRRAYLVWEDLAAGAMFAHPNVLVLVDARSGRVILQRTQQWWPLVDGHRPSFGPRTRVFASYAPKHRRRHHARPRAGEPGSFTVGPKAKNGPFAVTPADFAHDCLVMLGGHRHTGLTEHAPSAVDPDFKGNFDAMLQWALDVGLPVDPRPERTIDDARRTILDLQPGCSDVFLYITGHGREPGGTIKAGLTDDGDVARRAGKDQPAGIATDVHGVRRADGSIEDRSEYVTPQDLVELLGQFPKVGFKIKIDACFAGRFVDDLAGQPNLRVLEVSSRDDEVSYDRFPKGVRVKHDGKLVTYDGGIDNPTDATPFTNGDVHGLYRWARTEQAVDESRIDGVVELARGIAESFIFGEDFDVARHFDLTHPAVRTNYATSTPEPPAVTPPPAQPAPQPQPQPQPPARPRLGSFVSPISFEAGGFPSVTPPADLDGDGNLDAATINNGSGGTDGATIFWGDGAGGFLRMPIDLPGQPLGGAPGLFLGGPRPDLALTLQTSSLAHHVVLLPSTGARTFGAPVDLFGPIAGLTDIAAGDFDGDGRPDLGAINTFGEFHVLTNPQGGGTWHDSDSVASGVNGLRFLATGSLNGDGRLDAVATSDSTGQVGIFLSGPGGTFLPVPTIVTLPNGAQPEQVQTGDVTGDGAADIVFAERTADGGGGVGVLRNDGGGGFAGPPAFVPAPGSPGFGIGMTDFDGDGIPDLMTQDDKTGDLLLFRGTGGGSFSSPQRFEAGAGQSGGLRLGVGDATYDGLPDVFGANPNAGTLEFFRATPP